LPFLCLAVLALAVSEADYRQAFTLWTHQHNKVYSSEEFFARYDIFKANYDFVNSHNEQTAGFSVKLNKFADLTAAEFGKIYNGYRAPSFRVSKPHAEVFVADKNVQIPTSVDWRSKGAVTGVKDQGQCGSCWSFSSTGSMEGSKALAGQGLVSLSEQNLVDCSTAQGNMGCNGGLMDQAFEYVIQNGGIDTEASYPYTATGPNQCRYSAANIGDKISSYSDISSGDEDALAQAIAMKPVSVAIDASHSSFQFYNGGIYYEPACSSSQLDHGVLAIGYGDGYFLVKNSWGTSWGSAGYIQMSRGRSNNCGIATAASYPKQ